MIVLYGMAGGAAFGAAIICALIDSEAMFKYGVILALLCIATRPRDL